MSRLRYSTQPYWTVYTALTRRRRPTLLQLTAAHTHLRTMRSPLPAAEGRDLLTTFLLLLGSPLSFSDSEIYRAILLDLAKESPQILDALRLRDSALRSTARMLSSRLTLHIDRARRAATSPALDVLEGLRS